MNTLSSKMPGHMHIACRFACCRSAVKTQPTALVTGPYPRSRVKSTQISNVVAGVLRCGLIVFSLFPSLHGMTVSPKLKRGMECEDDVAMSQ